jgi:hypothetical protein
MRPMIKTYTILGMKKFVVLFFVLSLMVYFFTSAGKTPFDYFTRLSDSFLQGKIYLTENPRWLSELIPSGPGRFYVVYPPMPAILSMPFRFIFGENFQQQYLAHLLGAGVVALTMLSAWTIKRDKKLLIWTGILTGFGNIIWFLSSVGSSWYLGQVSAAFFLSFALYVSLTKKRPFIVGLLLGAAYLSRIHTIISFPVFIYLLKDKNRFKNYLLLGLGSLPFILSNFVYNYLRFGVIWDKAYFILPGILHELDKPWFIKGVTNIAYIPNNLLAAFWSFPVFLNHPPYIEPSWSALAIWVTTPAFIFALFSPLKERLTQLLWLSVVLIFAIVASHGGTGWAQFGYRFAVDFYPFLLLLVIKSVAKTGLKPIHWALLFISVLVNFWGVVWINKFGWVSF